MRLTTCLFIGTLALGFEAYAQVSTVVSGEYFFDSDPGFGQATPLPGFAANQNIDISFLASASALSKGMHVFAIRVLDSDNAWSMPVYTPIYVLASDPGAMQDVAAAEYFFDMDPGIGNATSVAIGSAGPVINFSFVAASSGLPTGMHVLAVRTRNTLGAWSIATYTPVYVDRSRTISKLEYFFDTDPGVGNAVEIDVSPDTDVLDQIFNMNSSSLSPAAHTLNVRVAGQNDFWSITETANFVICSAATPSISADVVCVGSATTFTDNSTVQSGDAYSWDFESDGVTDDGTSGARSFTYPSAGTYTATLTIDRGGCIASTTTTVTVDDVATATAGAGQVICETGTAALNATVGGTASTGLWSSSGDGFFDNNAALNAEYTPGATDITTGNVTLTFTTEDPVGACPAVTTTTPVTVSPLAIADAGADQNLCPGTSAVLSGSIGGSASSSTWSTSGDGIFDNENILTAIYTPGANDLINGSAVLTLMTAPAGACLSQSDQATITITHDISLVSQTLNATIANAVSVSVTAGGTFNTGDVLTSSIVTGPQKGTAQLQSGNVLEYVANSQTVGNDTVYVQVCNQCTQCDGQYMVFSIQNVPPAISIPPATTPAGSTLIIAIAASISDDNGNIDLSTATIVQQPSSGAMASIDNDHNLVLDYSNVPNFNGMDALTIEVCDDLDACAQYVIAVQVGVTLGEVVVYNAVAPKSSGENKYMRILNLPPGNKVSIYNRWGDRVFEVDEYNNDVAGKRFDGHNESGTALPSGTYFYRIEIPHSSTGDGELITGYVAVKQ